MIYFVCAFDHPDCLVKIGVTKGPAEKRLSSLQAGNPFVLRILATMRGGHTEERVLHHVFRKDRRHGEWFYPSGELREFLRNRMNPSIDVAAKEAIGDENKQTLFADVLGWTPEMVRDGLVKLLR